MDISVTLQPSFFSDIAISPAGGGMGMGVAFPAQPTQNFTVPAGGAIESVESLGGFSPDHYKITATFTDPLSSVSATKVELL